MSLYNLVDWRGQSQSFAQMTTYDYDSLVLTGQKTLARLGAVFVTGSFFDVLKVSAFKGRTFVPNEGEPGKARVAVLSYGAWLRHFGGDPGIVGKSILLDDQAYSVIGIMPSNFGFPDEGVEIWCVLGFNLKQSGRGSHFLQAIGRLKPGVSLQQAQAEMNIIAERLSATYDQPGSRVRLVPLQEEVLDSGYLDASGKTRG